MTDIDQKKKNRQWPKENGQRSKENGQTMAKEKI